MKTFSPLEISEVEEDLKFLNSAPAAHRHNPSKRLAAVLV